MKVLKLLYMNYCTIIRLIYKEIWVPIMMIQHTILAWSNTILYVIDIMILPLLIYLYWLILIIIYVLFRAITLLCWQNWCSLWTYRSVWSKCVLIKLQYYRRRFSENYARSRWSSKQILFDYMCFYSII